MKKPKDETPEDTVCPEYFALFTVAQMVVARHLPPGDEELAAEIANEVVINAKELVSDANGHMCGGGGAPAEIMH